MTLQKKKRPPKMKRRCRVLYQSHTPGSCLSRSAVWCFAAPGAGGKGGDGGGVGQWGGVRGSHNAAFSAHPRDASSVTTTHDPSLPAPTASLAPPRCRGSKERSALLSPARRAGSERFAAHEMDRPARHASTGVFLGRIVFIASGQDIHHFNLHQHTLRGHRKAVTPWTTIP